MNAPTLTDRCALVTGAGARRGMGRAIALGLARAGAAVACLDVDHAAAADCAAQITAAGGRALALGADVANAAQVRQAVAQVVAQWGRLDILINNAGIAHFCALLELSEQDWDRVMHVNLKGVFLCAQAAGRQMRQQGGGHIINIGSISAQLVGKDKVHYCAAKAGVHQLTRGLALELAPHGIRVNELAPGDIDTDIVKQPEIQQLVAALDLAGMVPLGRRGRAEDVVGAVLFLLSPAADYITGATLTIDGGLTSGTSFPTPKDRS